jgi:CheY-like chemotaxis protein/HPt (histidine-containing phosphotransfer) domain-containing protein
MPGIGSTRKLPTVLIIDDDMVSREVMATVLTMSGYLVHTAAEGSEAVALLDSKSSVPDVILMDAQMPGLNGPELIDQLRARCEASIYGISGSDAPEAMLKGVDGFLLKPIGPETLQRLLEKHAFEMTFHPTQRVQTPSDAHPPVISPKTLAQLRELMKEPAVREIYAAVLADLEKRRGALETAIEQGDFVTIRRIGHSIKGGCGMAGALEAARVGELLEAGGDNLEYIRSLVPLFESATRNLQRMLEAEFSPQGVDPAV